MALQGIQPGDMLYAATEIRNDGSLPDLPPDALIAKPGGRGVLIEIGHLQEDPRRLLYLVRFEDSAGVLGLATACWAEELRLATEAECQSQD